MNGELSRNEYEARTINGGVGALDSAPEGNTDVEGGNEEGGADEHVETIGKRVGSKGGAVGKESLCWEGALRDGWRMAARVLYTLDADSTPPAVLDLFNMGNARVSRHRGRDGSSAGSSVSRGPRPDSATG